MSSSDETDNIRRRLSAAGLPIPANETDRLRALAHLDVLDSRVEDSFGRIVGLAAQLCEAPMALILLIDAERQWYWSKIEVGTMRLHAFCAATIASAERVFSVADTTVDARFSSDPCVAGPPHVRFYAGAPLVTCDGHAIGALCVADQVPRTLGSIQLEALRVLADQVVMKLEYRDAIRQLEIQRRQLEKSQAEFALRSLTDPLTSLSNRRALDSRLIAELQRSARQGLPLSLAMVDVDHFKQYNDALGHQAGDEALCIVATCIANALRSWDFCARYGGEEFAVVLPDAAAGEALLVAERIREAVAKWPWPDVPLTVSVGVAECTPRSGQPEEQALAVIRLADRALYAAKRAGRDRISL